MNRLLLFFVLILIASPTFGAAPFFAKSLYVVDKSGSNTITDPQHLVRAKGIERLIKWQAAVPNSSWGILEFSGVNAKALTIGTDGMPEFTSDQGVLKTALAELISQPDSGATPYLAALRLVRVYLKTDLSKSPYARGNYVVYFYSDGAPTDGGDPVKEVMSLVQDFRGRIFLSTVGYGKLSPNAVELLTKMAVVGGGTFIDAR